jgi:hypothetical protein
VPLDGTRYLRSVTRSEPIDDRNTPAQVAHPIIASAIHLPNTVGDRVMSYVSARPIHCTSPAVRRRDQPLATRLPGESVSLLTTSPEGAEHASPLVRELSSGTVTGCVAALTPTGTQHPQGAKTGHRTGCGAWTAALRRP